MNQQVPPGWYPNEHGQQQWWDGYQWGPLAQPQPVVPQAYQPPAHWNGSMSPSGGLAGAPMQQTNAPYQRGSKVGSVLAFIATVVIILLVLGSCMYFRVRGGDGTSPGSYEAQAMYICQEMVTERLRAPSTADFGGWDVRTTSSKIVVQGHVDAENAFGGTVRNDFQCTVALDSEGEPGRVTLDYLQ